MLDAPMSIRCLPLASALTLVACVSHAPSPVSPPVDAQGGHAPHPFLAREACGRWQSAVGPGKEDALSHVSFPELDPRGCFIQVHYGPEGPWTDPIPSGCGYPGDPGVPSRLRREAERYRAIAEDRAEGPLPLDLACDLPADVRRATALSNARTLDRLGERLATGKRYPYAAAAAFGFGHSVQNQSRLIPYRPGQACPSLGKADMDLFGVNIVRAARAAEAYFADVAPVVILSGGAVHARLYEAFMLDYVATCKLGVRADAVLLDPCADHTHTNLRNTGALLVELGARTGYVVTDDGVQADYLQEWTGFDLIGGSIDQRSLRDFGYLLGSYRQASVGMDAGFWYTPYRFWAEPVAGLGGFTCLGP